MGSSVDLSDILDSILTGYGRLLKFVESAILHKMLEIINAESDYSEIKIRWKSPEQYLYLSMNYGL